MSVVCFFPPAGRTSPLVTLFQGLNGQQVASHIDEMLSISITSWKDEVRYVAFVFVESQGFCPHKRGQESVCYLDFIESPVSHIHHLRRSSEKLKVYIGRSLLTDVFISLYRPTLFAMADGCKSRRRCANLHHQKN